ncbi:MAG: DUF3307 domain-containing protein [Anaerovoracaceae bacterium]
MTNILLLTAHLLGDFVFQNSELVERKKVDSLALIKHSAIYAAFMFIALIMTQELKLAIVMGVIIGISHYAIDGQKNKITKNELGIKKDLIVFLIDQAIHIILLIIVAEYILDLYPAPNTLIGQIIDKYSYPFVMESSVIILLYVLCAHPIGVIIKKVFLMWNARSKQQLLIEETLGAGFVIGILERLVILTLGLLGEFGAVGLVLAAKGLARFEQLKDKDFAEKYLIGTLLSVLIALGCVLIIKIV